MVEPKFAMLQKIGSHPLQRAATEHSREPLSSDSKADYAPARSVSTHERRIAAEHSGTRGCELDPDIRLQKSESVGAVCIPSPNARRKNRNTSCHAMLQSR